MSASVGQQLRQARQARNKTLEQVSRATYIRAHYLEALEAGRLDFLPSEAQARGFLRAYAGYLNIDPAPLVKALQEGGVPDLTQAAESDSRAESQSTEAGAAGEIFAEIGRSLRQHRELLGITLLDVERQTHVRMRYLEALENGNLDELPSPVQGRGMLNNYAAFLGLDPDPILLKFADGLQTRLSVRRGKRGDTALQPGSKQTRRGAAPLRRLISGDLIFGGTLIVALLAFVVWGAIRITSMQAEQIPPATAPSIVDVLLPSPTPSSTPTPATATPTLPADDGAGVSGNNTPTPDTVLPISNEDAVQIYVVVRERAWMRVTVDGEVAFDGRAVPGSAYPFSGQDTVEVLTGSGSALQIFYNQQDLGPMGLFGEVIQRVFTTDGILLPTATITPTPTITPTSEATETETSTPTVMP